MVAKKVLSLLAALGSAILLASCTPSSTSSVVPSSSQSAQTSQTSSQSQSSSNPTGGQTSSNPTTSTNTSSSTPAGVDAIASITAEGTYTVRGWVIAKNSKAIVVSDGTAGIMAFDSAITANIGDYVEVSGAVSQYNGLFQFSFSNTPAVSVTAADKANAPAEPKAIALTAAIADSWKANSGSLSTKDVQLYTWTATAAQTGGYTTLNIAGSSTVIEPVYQTQNIEVGKTYTVTAAFAGYSDKYGYASVVLKSVVEGGSTNPDNPSKGDNGGTHTPDVPAPTTTSGNTATTGSSNTGSSSSTTTSGETSSTTGSTGGSTTAPSETTAPISSITAKGTYTVKGWVIAKNSNSVVVSDGTAGIMAFDKNKNISANIGDYVEVSGAVSQYNGLLQFSSTNTPAVTVTAADKANAPAEPKAVALTADIANGWKANSGSLSTKDVQLYTWTAKAAKSGKYFTLNIDGSSTVIEPVYQTQTIEEGKTYTVTAAFAGYSDNYGYAAVVLKDIQETGGTPTPTEPTAKSQTVLFDDKFNSGFETITADKVVKRNVLDEKGVATFDLEIDKNTSKSNIALDGNKLKYVNPLRIYQGAALTISIPKTEGKKIASISIPADKDKPFNAANASSDQGTVSDDGVLTVTDKAGVSSITIQALKQFRATSLTVTYVSNSSEGGTTTPSTGAVKPGENGVPNVVAKYNKTKDEYYSGIDFQKKNLLTDLRTLVNTDTTKYEYRDTSTRLIYTDEDPDNPGKLLGTYDGTLLPSKWDSGTTWNKEHTWPKSRLKVNGKTPTDTDAINADLFNLRAAKSATNGSRGNKFFDEKDVTGTFYPNLVEGGHDFRGDVARICFYMYVRWDGLKLINATDSSDGVSMGNLATLLAWAKEDPVDAFETQKNDRVYQYQGNRNPFIDYPTLYTQIDFTK